MKSISLTLHEGLVSTSRVRRLVSERTSADLSDWAILASFGILAALSSTFLNTGIRGIPGQAILRVVFPIAIGLALVPRRGAGTVMGGTAFVSGVLLRVVDLQSMKAEPMGLGALTSLAMTGPILDLALRKTKGGWRQYVAFAVAGLTSNGLAMLVRGAAKAVGWEHAGGRPLGEWLARASVSYLVCGLAAGLISGMILFGRPKAGRHNNTGATSEVPH